MSDEDVAVAREAGGEPIDLELDGGLLRRLPGRVRRGGLRPLLQRDREPDPLVHPALSLGPLERPGHPPGGARRLGEGYKVVNRDIAEAVLRMIADEESPLVMLHDYHLYTCPALIRARAAGRLPSALRPHPVVAAGLLADPAGPLARADLPRDARQRHHRLPHLRLLPQLPALLPRADGGRGRLRARRRPPRRSRDLGARLPARDRRRPPRPGGRLRGGRATTSASSCAAAATT